MEKGDKRVAQRDKKCCREGMYGCHWISLDEGKRDGRMDKEKAGRRAERRDRMSE